MKDWGRCNLPTVGPWNRGADPLATLNSGVDPLGAEVLWATGRDVSREKSNVSLSVYAPTGDAGYIAGIGRGPKSLDALRRMAGYMTGPRGGVNPLPVEGMLTPVALSPILCRGSGSQAGGSAHSSIKKKLINPSSFGGEAG